ncbi:MAG: O-antigen ligase family protein [Gallionella sp.]|nr:O-antigen ligase family protein [Gallionella sp.]
MSMMESQSDFEKRLFYGLLALLVWLPLPVASNRPWAEAILEIWVGLLLLLWLVGWQRKTVALGTGVIGAKPMLWLLAIWLVYLAFALFPLPLSMRLLLSPESARVYQLAGVQGWTSLSVHSYAGFLYWMKSAAYALLFILILLLVNSKRRLVMLAYTLVLSGLFQAFYGSIMTLSGVEYGFFIKKEAYLGFATGTFVNRNHLAGYLEMILAIGIGLMMASASSATKKRTWRQYLRMLINLLLSQKLVLRLMLAMMVIALVLTRSRMGNTAFFSSMLVAGLIFLLMLRVQSGSFGEMFSRRETRGTVILLCSLMLIDLFIVGAWFGVEKVVARIEQSSVLHDADRVEVSLNTIKLWQDYPLLGSGGGSFYAAYPRYRPATIGAFFDHTHEDYLEIAADTGLVGLGLLGLAVAMSFVVALVALKRRRDPLMRGMAFASMMGMIALMIHSTVDFNLQIPANAATFMVILALAWIALNLDKRTGVQHSST